MSTPRQLHAWRDADLACVASLLGTATVAWRRAWGLDLPAVEVACTIARPREADGWQRVGSGGAWLQWSAMADSEMRSLFGPGFDSCALAVEAASACREDACRRLAAVLALGGSLLQGADAMPSCGKWSGFVDAVLACGSVVRMDAATVACVLETQGRLPRPRPPTRPQVTPLLEAAGDRATRIEARLAGCELDLALLQRLRIGDVLRLPHPLATPLALHGPGDDPLFAGFLARSGDHKAVELVPRSA